MDQGSNVSPGNNQPALTWRDVLPVHPAAELLPRMSNAELEELRTDIAANGLHTPVIILLSDDGTEQLLDGINRLDAMALAGKKVVKEDGTFNHDEVLHQHVRGNTDPYRFVLSVNLYRRHLTNEQKTDLIAKLLELKPAASDRQIASLTGTSHPTVAKVRREMTAGGKITTSPTRTDKRGREQPATKPSTAAATTAITGMPVAEPESKVCMPVVEPKPEAAGSNFKEPDVFAPLWNVIEASDRVAEVGRHEFDSGGARRAHVNRAKENPKIPARALRDPEDLARRAREGRQRHQDRRHQQAGRRSTNSLTAMPRVDVQQIDDVFLWGYGLSFPQLEPRRTPTPRPVRRITDSGSRREQSLGAYFRNT